MIGFLTDFGNKDGFVGAVKGVIKSINEKEEIIDITHEIDSFNILEGALILKSVYSFFPKETIFLCVVDPGVGSKRKPIILKTKSYTFVGPHNGIFDLVLKENTNFESFEIKKEIKLKTQTNTFHARDLFGVAAGLLSLKKDINEIANKTKYEFKLNFPEPIKKEDKIYGKIIYYDKFGNGITNIPCMKFKKALLGEKEVRYFDYYEKAKNNIGITCSSFGFLEFFIYKKSFKELVQEKDFILLI